MACKESFYRTTTEHMARCPDCRRRSSEYHQALARGEPVTAKDFERRLTISGPGLEKWWEDCMGARAAAQAGCPSIGGGYLFERIPATPADTGANHRVADQQLLRDMDRWSRMPDLVYNIGLPLSQSTVAASAGIGPSHLCLPVHDHIHVSAESPLEYASPVGPIQPPADFQLSRPVQVVRSYSNPDYYEIVPGNVQGMKINCTRWGIPEGAAGQPESASDLPAVESDDTLDE